jgi:lipopolysaccharide biosynthesis glycosyltransferase
MEHKCNSITVVTVCDNHFAVMLAALLKSIEVNHRSPLAIDMYIIEDEMTDANKAKIISTVNDPILSLHWLKMADVVDKTKLPLDASTFPLNVYTRLFIPHFLPVSCIKAIYLDVDMIVRTDLSELWNVDLEDKIIAGVPDRAPLVSTGWAGISNYEALELAPETTYYNSGLLVIDLVKWRNSNLTQEIIDCIIKNKRFASFPDQYGLNVVFANRWRKLDSRWNTYSSSNDPEPLIIHFIGRKPIFSSYDKNMEYKNEFFSYLSLTSFSSFKPLKEYMRFSKKLYNMIEKKMKTLFKSQQL